MSLEENTDEQTIQERKVQRFFAKTYDYPGKMEVQLHSIYDPEREKYMLVQYSICNDEETLQKLTFAYDSVFTEDSSNYKAMQDNGFIDGFGNPTEKSQGREQDTKRSSLADKIKDIKKEKSCDNKCEDCDC